MLDASTGPGDLVVVHSIPSGVLGIARYYRGEAELAAWVEQLGQRSAPASLLSMAHPGRGTLVRVHEVGVDCPVEVWLRDHATVDGEGRRESARLLSFGLPARTTF